MEVKNKIIVGLVILIIIVIISSSGLTGKTIESMSNRYCEDDDNGHNYIEKGTTQSRGTIETKKRVDSCHTNTEVIEYYCTEYNLVKSEIKDCTSLGTTKCELGKCI